MLQDFERVPEHFVWRKWLGQNSGSTLHYVIEFSEASTPFFDAALAE